MQKFSDKEEILRKSKGRIQFRSSFPKSPVFLRFVGYWLIAIGIGDLFPIANIIPLRTKLNAKYTKVLRNSGVVVEEDLSRAAKNRRRELEKFVKEIKAIDGNKKCVLK